MKQVLLALAAGALFGAGLALSGMADPAKVRGFLDIFGAWNPTLIFVMAGALIPMGLAWRVQAKLRAPLAAERFNLPDITRVDARLIGGAILFGIGWGIAGLCPGPAIADLALAPRPAVIFVLAM
ncbi:MAG: YeeE/YedE family protein, partial [Rhodospirillales bacterium]|nr:YeeE/YedE family protein [Rhodospirillales bacterium]